MDDVKVGGIVYPIEIKEDFTGDTLMKKHRKETHNETWKYNSKCKE